MVFNTKVNFLFGEVDCTKEGIEVLNAQQLKELKVDSNVLDYTDDLSIGIDLDGLTIEDPYKIVPTMISYIGEDIVIKDNILQIVQVFKITAFKYAELFFIELDDGWTISEGYTSNTLKSGLNCEQIEKELQSLKNNHVLISEMVK